MKDMKSRLLDLLKSDKRNFDLDEILDEIELYDDEDEKTVVEELHTLETEGRIFKSKQDKYMTWHNGLGRVFGNLIITRKGEGLIRDAEGNKYVVRKGCFNGALSGDKVILNRLRNHQERIEGEVERVVERGSNNIICEVISRADGRKDIIPLTSNRDLDMTIDIEEVQKYLIGDRLLLFLSADKIEDKYEARIVKRICHKDDPKSDVITKAAEYSFDFEFPDEVIEQVKRIPQDIKNEDISRRVDLRDKMIFTIDGADTKDMDDAISLEILDNGNYKLGVHIADVAHYVKPGTPLFKEALKRGTSAYLLDSVFPMLPRELSNGICSLNPEEDRLTKTCEMEIDPSGKIIGYKIFDSVIRSRKKMSYECVNQILENDITPEGYEQYRDLLLEMNRLSNIMQKRRISNGAIEFEKPEVKIYTKEDGKFDHISVKQQRAAEILIENFMLAANESVATKTAKHRFPSIYRVHDVPDNDKMNAILEIVHLNIPEMPRYHDLTEQTQIQKFLEDLKSYDQYPIFSNMILRGLSKAVYSGDNIGHYGLGLKNYTHFTSPIRRFPDLLLHTLLDVYGKGPHLMTNEDRKLISSISEMAIHCSDRERLEKKAEYDINDMKVAEHLAENVGMQMEGTVTEVTRTLIRVQTDDLMEGVIRFSDIEPRTFYKYYFKPMKLKSPDDEIKLGDRLLLEVKSACKDTGMVNFCCKGHVYKEDMQKTDENTKVKVITSRQNN